MHQSQSKDEGQLQQIRTTQNLVKELLADENFTKFTENPNLTQLKMATRALQIIKQTSNVDIDGIDNALRRLILNFGRRV